SFLKPSQITKQEDLCKKTETQGKHIKTACTDSHTAENDLWTAISWREACDENGVFGMTCWHDVLLKFTNIYNLGEKLHYPVSLLAIFLSDIPHQQVGVHYDIRCHLNVHIKMVLYFLFFSCSCSQYSNYNADIFSLF
ncbi:hypothetical protein CROQUDRAFT_37987, partial [Cronartium quercuum f. sp. fusiforme G11]